MTALSGIFQGTNLNMRLKQKIPCLYRGVVWNGVIYTPMIVRPNVPQMAELPCLLGVFHLSPLNNKGFTVILLAVGIILDYWMVSWTAFPIALFICWVMSKVGKFKGKEEER